MTVFDDLYRSTPYYFGREADRLLLRFCGKLPARARVLDIGAGQGRNALFLARIGHPVDAIEPSTVAAGQLQETVSGEHLPIQICSRGFEAFSLDTQSYPGVLVLGLIQELPRESSNALMGRINAWTAAGSLAFVTAFTIEDPSYPEISRTWRPIGKDSFSNDAGFMRTFLDTGELRKLFDGWEAIHYWEGPGPEHRHGAGPPHRHGRVEAVFCKLV